MKWLSLSFVISLFLLSAGLDCAKAQTVEFNSPPAADKLINPFKNNPGGTQEGKLLFEKYCIACHGKNGKGDGPTAVSLNPRPANFQQKKIKEETDGALFWKISSGKAGTAMISWEHTLTPDQRWKIIDYIRSLQK